MGKPVGGTSLSRSVSLFLRALFSPLANLIRRKWLRRAVISSGFLICLLLSLFFALPALLIAPANVAPSDVILHISISPQSKADEYIADLYRRSVARKIVCVSSQVSWELYPGDYARTHLIALGVPAEDVISLRMPITHCVAMNLPRIVEFVKTNGWRSALLITHPEDSRYAARLTRGFFEKEDIAIAVGYAPEDREELTRNWSRTHWKTQRFVGEVMNFTLDMFYSECR